MVKSSSQAASTTPSASRIKRRNLSPSSGTRLPRHSLKWLLYRSRATTTPPPSFCPMPPLSMAAAAFAAPAPPTISMRRSSAHLTYSPAPVRRRRGPRSRVWALQASPLAEHWPSRLRATRQWRTLRWSDCRARRMRWTRISDALRWRRSRRMGTPSRWWCRGIVGWRCRGTGIFSRWQAMEYRVWPRLWRSRLDRPEWDCVWWYKGDSRGELRETWLR